MSEKLDSAIRIAVKCHAGQVDKAGQPYILHPLRVMNAVRHEGETAMIAAVLHDVVEDSDMTIQAINSVFGDDVSTFVDALTRKRGQWSEFPQMCRDETYKEFILRVKLNPLATKIKIADLYDNLSRIDQLPESERGIRKRYETALTELGAPLWDDDAISPSQECYPDLELIWGHPVMDKILPWVDAMQKERYLSRKAIKLMIGRRSNTPWSKIPDSEVNAWIASANA